MNIRKIIILTIGFFLVTYSAFAAHPTYELKPEEIEKENFKIYLTKVYANKELYHVYLEVPKIKSKLNIELSSMGFYVIENEESLISSDLFFQEETIGSFAGRFTLHKKMLESTKLYVTYGIQGGATYTFNIPLKNNQKTNQKTEKTKEGEVN